MQEKVSREIAQEEVEAWMDAKKVGAAKRDSDLYREAKEALINGVMYGRLSFNTETGQLTQYLDFPLELKDKQGNTLETISKLPIRNRISEDDISAKLKGKDHDGLNILRAYAAAITSQPMAVIGRLDSEDSSLLKSVASFFM